MPARAPYWAYRGVGRALRRFGAERCLQQRLRRRSAEARRTPSWSRCMGAGRHRRWPMARSWAPRAWRQAARAGQAPPTESSRPIGTLGRSRPPAPETHGAAGPRWPLVRAPGTRPLSEYEMYRYETSLGSLLSPCSMSLHWMHRPRCRQLQRHQSAEEAVGAVARRRRVCTKRVRGRGSSQRTRAPTPHTAAAATPPKSPAAPRAAAPRHAPP